MLVVVHDWVGVDAEVEQLDGAITAGGKQLVLVDFGPCQVVQCVICVEAKEGLVSDSIHEQEANSKEGGSVRLLYLDSSRRQAERKETAIADNAKVGGGGNSHSVVIIWGVLDGIRIESPCSELKHSSHVE